MSNAGGISKAVLTISDYEEVLADKRRLVRELDIIMNGENAAKQASLVDIIGQARKWKQDIDQLTAKDKEIERLKMLIQAAYGAGYDNGRIGGERNHLYCGQECWEHFKANNNIMINVVELRGGDSPKELITNNIQAKGAKL